MEKILYILVISFCSGRIYDESKKPLTYICRALVGPAAFAEVIAYVLKKICEQTLPFLAKKVCLASGL